MYGISWLFHWTNLLGINLMTVYWNNLGPMDPEVHTTELD